jgi:hypothetical protein
MNCACEEPSLLCWLATHNKLVIMWKILGSCIQLACTCYQKLTCVLGFLGGNKQINKTKKPILFYNFFLKGFHYFSVTVCEEVIYYCKLHTLEHTALSFGNN